ncbi:Prostaglandin reductase-3 [Thalictrum thalictroides]|uniref:Prostaglandin reductase-3 n=1 Tax=Thalictrum thalictroides TaxID=46969 RepID=A0A7J6WAQ6_THATH|nr:Prostaglandin reductase-3 [Thalictrum thalictroides]
MELKPGLSALITGGGSGIGKAIALALAKKGIFLTIVDFAEERGKEVASLAEKDISKFHSDLKFPPAVFVRCDVTNTSDISAAFAKHLDTYGGLDICINSAGIGSSIPFKDDKTNSWRHTINVNLIAVIDCTRLAIETMLSGQRPGVIINLGSASGLYPMYVDPIYSGSKGGVVLFTRSLVPYKSQGIRINVLCPEFVQTDLASRVDPKIIDITGGYLPMEMVIDGAFELIQNESKAGSCLWISKRRGLEYWPTPTEEAKYLVKSSNARKRYSNITKFNIQLPQSYEKIVVHTLNHNFRTATSIVRTQLTLPIGPRDVLLKVIYAGVNASDVNFSSGRYFGGSDKELSARLPFDAGFEAVGLIAAVGASVNHLKVGTPAAIMTFGGYAQFVKVPSKHVLPVPEPRPEVVAMLTSGLTASIALEKAAQMDSGKVVLVTAAAGGTGQFAVQLAKLAGNQVVATCGGQEKAALLKKMGVDRVIDYKAENIKAVLKKEFPKGVDIVYESVGGEMFDLCLNALAVYGRLIVIGMISQYQGEHGWKPLNYTGLCEKILAKSQTVVGFFLVQYSHLWQQHLDSLFQHFSSKKLQVNLDPKKFLGLGSVADAVEYLHSGKSAGKVVVCIDPSFDQQMSKM